jgi:membrane protein DedA with SNARE-associated domain
MGRGTFPARVMQGWMVGASVAAYLEHLLHAYGYAAIVAVIALENVGLPVPGETILITSGIFAATTHELSVTGVVMTAAFAAFGGSVAGFMIGRYGERHFLHRLGFDERDLRLGRYLVQRFGGRVVFIARFIAFLRSAAGLLAGANAMALRRFLIASGLGALAWSASFGFAAYALGREIEALSARAAVAVGILLLLVAFAGLRFLRRNRARFQIEADRAARVAGR